MASNLSALHRRLVAVGLIGAGSILELAQPALAISRVEVLHVFVRAPQGPFAELAQGSDGALYGTTSWGGAFGYGAVFKVDARSSSALLHSFNASVDGAFPQAALVQGGDGALYGTTPQGGRFGSGTLFKIDENGQFTLLHSFNEPVDGSLPLGALLQGSDGALYGTAYRGGTSGSGTLFKIDENGQFILLHSFNGSVDGSSPEAALVQGSDGALYGTTGSGGTFGSGTLFKIDENGQFTSLHSFNGSVDGSYPRARLVLGSDGGLYGTSSEGGRFGYGTIFKIDARGVFASMHDFGGFADGLHPQAPLAQGADGALYGTTGSGGVFGSGTLFKIDESSQFTLLHSFNGSVDGAHPSAALVQGSDSALYGSTIGGGALGDGTLFRIAASGQFVLLHSFNHSVDGAHPSAALVQGIDGALYGTTPSGGPLNYGTVFKLDESDTFMSLSSFATDGSGSAAALVPGSNDALYGSTQEGGAFGDGTLFKIDARGGFESVHSFDYAVDGAYPHAALVQASDGLLYGTTLKGGALGSGTLFKIDAEGIFTLLHSFSESEDGGFPYAPLVEGSDRALYGTTIEGGAFGDGTVFRIDAGGSFRVLHSFDRNTDGSNPEHALVLAEDGSLYGVTGSILFKIDSRGTFTRLNYVNTPSGALVEGRDRALYGATGGGGDFGVGTLFKLDLGGTFTLLHSFDYSMDGAYPAVALVQGRDRAFYGATLAGGTFGHGALFKIDAGGGFTPLHSFNPAVDGAFPFAALVRGRDGALYGTTFDGGAFGHGTLFRVETNGTFSLLHSFHPSVEGTPSSAPLVQGREGVLYGTTGDGGPGGGGVIFCLDSQEHHRPSHSRHCRASSRR